MIHWIFLGLALAWLGVLYSQAKSLDSWDDALWSGPVFFGGILTVLVGAAWLVLAVGAAECRQISASSGHRTEYYAIGGCFIEISDGRTIPIDERSMALIVDSLSE